MPRSNIETTTWVSEQILKIKGVAGVEVMSPFTFRVNREDLPSFEALVFSEQVVTEELLAPLLFNNPNATFAMNVPRSGKWSKSGISTARSNEVAFGSMGDLMAAINGRLEDVRDYQKKENAFVERILRQHTCVSKIEQEADRLYWIGRNNGDPMRIVILNEYELTGDRVRAAVDDYGAFDIILMTNPSGSATSDARDVSKALKVPILNARQLLGRLNVR